MRTELKIYSSSAYYNVDLYDDESLVLSKSVVDLTNPEERVGDYTKTIKIPGSKNNNTLFSNIFQIEHSTTSTVQFTPDFNANLKADSKIGRAHV